MFCSRVVLRTCFFYNRKRFCDERVVLRMFEESACRRLWFMELFFCWVSCLVLCALSKPTINNYLTVVKNERFICEWCHI